MSSAAEMWSRDEPTASEAPRLRLIPRDERAGTEASALRPVLVAGGDAERRADVRDRLAGTMPRSTRFEEAGAVWEVLAHAPDSRMVVLSGDVEELPAEELLHMLGHRHPDLPVVSLQDAVPAGA